MSQSALRVIPPSLPADSVYTSCYCEENIYLLAQALCSQIRLDEGWAFHVVFISNERRTVALWNQKAGQDVVVWDYHVILVSCRRTKNRGQPSRGDDGHDPASECDAYVYDFDTRLPVPCKWTEYMRGSFPYAFDMDLATRVGESYRSVFRVIPALAYLDYFASDRSHMLEDTLDPVVRYRSPPPGYAPLRGPKARELGNTHNLMTCYVSMPLPIRHSSAPYHDAVAQRPYGEVMDIIDFVGWLSGERS